MSQPETITVETAKVACDGVGGDLGHPRVYLTMQHGEVDCPYCGRKYLLAKDAKAAGAH